MVEIEVGPWLDMDVAKAIGWKHIDDEHCEGVPPDGAYENQKIPNYSADLNAAFDAAEKAGLFKCDTQDGPGTNLSLFQGVGFWWITNGTRRPIVQFADLTPALVICEAILELKETTGG